MVSREDTVEIEYSGSDGSLKMRAPYPTPKSLIEKIILRSTSPQRVARESKKVVSFLWRGEEAERKRKE